MISLYIHAHDSKICLLLLCFLDLLHVWMNELGIQILSNSAMTVYLEPSSECVLIFADSQMENTSQLRAQHMHILLLLI